MYRLNASADYVDWQGKFCINIAKFQHDIIFAKNTVLRYSKSIGRIRPTLPADIGVIEGAPEMLMKF